MRVFDMVKLLAPEFDPVRSKIHLACSNGLEDPVDVFLAGNFPEWQGFQTQRNFERPLVFSLIRLEERDRWLFGGLHNVVGPCVPIPNPRRQGQILYSYPTSEVTSTSALTGRLVAQFERPGRQSYLLAEKWMDQITLAEIYPKRLSIGTFPGFRSVELSFGELQIIAGQNLESWRSALSSVAGVYLISDTSSGKLYVGSASGTGGIWQRWSGYAATSHGGNVELRALLAEDGLERAKSFRFSILEIADIHTGDDDVLARESHWKRVLLSRQHGHNGN